DELLQDFESVASFNQEISERLQGIKKYFNSKHTLANYITDETVNMSKSKQGEKEPSEELLESNPHDLLVLDIVADHLTCPFTQEVTDDYRILPCKHKISFLALDTFMKMNYNELKCFYCNIKVDISDTERLPTSPIYKALHERFVEAGHIQPNAKGSRMTDFATIVEKQNVDNDDIEESAIRKSKFLNLLKMKPKKAFVQ